MDILLDHRNKPAEEFFIFLKIQDGRRRPKVQNRPNFTPQITFFAITWIRFIGFRQNLAWTYYLTLGTSLRKNFSFFSKSKMAAGGQKFATRYTFSMFFNNFDPVDRIQTKFGMDILLDPRNKPAEEFFIFLKIQDGGCRHYGKLRNRS